MSVVVSGQLVANGTAEAKIVVTSQLPDQPFGSLIVLGGEGARCVLHHMELSNGSEAVQDGQYASGAFFINGCDTDASHLVVQGNHSEDGMNIKNADAHIRNSTFSGNLADQLDLDNVDGTVVDCVFVQGASSNGDGVDVSGAQVVIRGSTFSGFLDKGVSIGEGSEIVVTQSTFEKNKLAIAVKDGSKAYLRDNIFRDNEQLVSMYIKKPFFDPPVAFWEGSRPEGAEVATANGAELHARSPAKDFETKLQTPAGISQLFTPGD